MSKSPSKQMRLDRNSARRLKRVERKLLEATLHATGGNRTRAAEMMGVSLRTIRNKIREYGLAAREAV